MSDVRPITPAQKIYLRHLAHRHRIWPGLTREQTIAKMNALVEAGMSQAEATALINHATEAPRHASDQTPASDWQIQRVRTLAAQNAIFGLTVNVEETIARVEAAINAPCFSSDDAQALLRAGHRAAPHPTAQTPLRLADIEGIDGLHVSEGHYAVFDEADVLRFYRIYTPTSGANRDIPVIRRIAGDNLLGLYPDEARNALTVIDAAPDDAAYRYSDTFARCWVCGKNLTDSVSRLLSVGPTCRGFANHGGLRVAANEVDHNPERRQVYRALREWALDNGFTDPRTREDRTSITMSASRVASAWSGIPGILGLTPQEATAEVSAALSGQPLNDNIVDGLTTAPKDTLLILIDSGVLSTTVMQVLTQHPDAAVKEAAASFFLAQFGN